jgi:hypothetical protein
MKTIITLLALVLVTGLAMGQATTYPVRPVTEVILLSDSVCSGATYAGTQADTTVAYSLANYTSAYIIISTTDSASIAAPKYSASIDGVTFEDGLASFAAGDSVSTVGQGAGAANGIVRAIPVPLPAMALQAVKFVFTFNAVSLQGVTTPKYTAWLVRK